jgi:hypothetical protein
MSIGSVTVVSIVPNGGNGSAPVMLTEQAHPEVGVPLIFKFPDESNAASPGGKPLADQEAGTVPEGVPLTVT